MDNLSVIRKPIEAELAEFIRLFNDSLQHSNGLLQKALDHVLQRGGKRMRPILTLLIAKALGEISHATYNAGIGLELLHTASLVHDDVVDDAETRRGQASVNAEFQNKVAVLVGDYILSTALIKVNQTGNLQIVDYLSHLGQTLSEGEILQLSNISNEKITEEVYYSIIKRKTAALFEACCAMGAMSVSAPEDRVGKVREFGQLVGIVFQIRDDIFDYYESSEIGKPTGNDMAEGKLTLPAIHAILTTQDAAMTAIAYKVKARTATADEIARLVAFTKQNGGIEYAEQVMQNNYDKALRMIDEIVTDNELRAALIAYLDFVIKRSN